MAKQPVNNHQPRSHGKVSSEDAQDVLDQFVVEGDEEDEEQLSAGETDDNDDEDDSSTTDPVEDEDNNDDVDDQPEEVDELDPKNRFAQDKKGNLLDKNGKIVATAGKERGIFEKLRGRLKERETALANSATQLAQIAAGTRDLMQKYKALQEEKGYGQQLGLEASEQKEALELFARSKIDPKAVIKHILTKAHLAGTDLSDIGVSGPLDPAVVARHVYDLQKAEEAKNKPTTTEPVRQDDGQEEAKKFFNDHPEAMNEPEELLNAVAQAKNRFPHLSLSHIYTKIKLHVVQQNKKPQGKIDDPARRVNPHNGGSGSERRSNKKGIDIHARSPSNSFNDIGKELLRDLQSLED